MSTATSRRAASDPRGARSIRSRQRPRREFDPAVGKLPPVLHDGHDAAARKLIDDFAGLAARRLDRQRKYLGLPRIGNPIRQILWTSEHVIPPGTSSMA